MSERNTKMPEVLQRSLVMRAPRYDKDKGRRERIDELEAYLLESAFMQGELTETRVDFEQTLWPLEEVWANLTGWEHLRRTRTETAVTAAKRMVDPETYNAMEDIKWIITKLTQEIDRMERDSSKVSRAFSMETC